MSNREWVNGLLVVCILATSTVFIMIPTVENLVLFVTCVVCLLPYLITRNMR